MHARPFATSVVKKLSQAGHIAYFAGGWVRDHLLQHRSDDIDIATSASVEEIQKIFPKTIPVGISFGIVIVVEEGHHFEVATFRKESGYLDGRRPTSIERATPQEDAIRRDFTINGMFWDPIKEELHDYVNGQEDLKAGVIRAIGNPQDRFLEDRLRMMRAVRYSTRFNFPIEIETKQAIIARAEALFPSVAIERVWQEFKKLSHFAHFDLGLISLHELKLLPTIFPRLRDIPVPEIKHRLRHLSKFPKNTPTIAELMELFPDDSLEQSLELCDYLKLSGQDRDFVTAYHRAKHMFCMPLDWQQKLEPIEWATLYANPHSEAILGIDAIHHPEMAHSHQQRLEKLHPHIERIREQKPVVKAEDLIQQGILPGKHMGVLLKEAARLSVNLNLDTPLAVIEHLKTSPLWLQKE